METLTRVLSWAFVFGALATLIFTSFRPVWKDIAGAEVNIEQVQGTAGRPAERSLDDVPLTAQRDCSGTLTGSATEGCPEPTP